MLLELAGMKVSSNAQAPSNDVDWRGMLHFVPVRNTKTRVQSLLCDRTLTYFTKESYYDSSWFIELRAMHPAASDIR